MIFFSIMDPFGPTAPQDSGNLNSDQVAGRSPRSLRTRNMFRVRSIDRIPE